MRKDKKEKEEEEENTTASHTENIIIQGCSSRRQPLFAYYDFTYLEHGDKYLQTAKKKWSHINTSYYILHTAVHFHSQKQHPNWRGVFFYIQSKSE